MTPQWHGAVAAMPRAPGCKFFTNSVAPRLSVTPWQLYYLCRFQLSSHPCPTARLRPDHSISS